MKWINNLIKYLFPCNHRFECKDIFEYKGEAKCCKCSKTLDELTTN